MLVLLAQILALSWCCPVMIDAVLVGDEHFGRIEGGAFWVFTSSGVSIVNPTTCQIEHSFSQDALGQSLPRQWSKGVYMERVTPHQSADDDVPLTTNPLEWQQDKDAYILINSGEDTRRRDGKGLQGEVIVMDTTISSPSPVLRRIPVGSSPGNAYAVHNRNQFWTHSDNEGYFYVIDLGDEVKNHTGHPIKAKLATAHQGYLIWDIGIDDNTVSTTTTSSNKQVGYATSAGEQALFLIDMEEHKQMDSYNFSKDVAADTCAGAATMAHSKTNQHLYVECVGGGGILEFDVSRPSNPLFIQQHVHIGGKLLETPDQAYVTATDKGTSRMSFFAPQKTGQPSTDPYKIMVKGHPEAPVFFENPNTYDYIACMPLTQNTNRNHINPNPPRVDENGNDIEDLDYVQCDYFNGCSQATTPDDVNHGMCLYRDGKATGPLLAATKDDIAKIQNNSSPFGQACGLCGSEKSFRNNQQLCVCTPECGACAEEDYPTNHDDPILQTTGVMCVDVKDALLGVIHHSELIKGAGAVRQRRNKLDDPACGFDEPRRPHKLGAKVYDASISTVPSRELVIVDMRVMSLKCRVELPGEPAEVIYVPTSLHYKQSNSSNKVSGGMIAGIVCILVVVLGLLFYLVARRSRFSNRESLDVDVEKQTTAAGCDGGIVTSIEMTKNSNGHKTNPGQEEEDEEKSDEVGGEEGTFVSQNGLSGEPPALRSGQLT